MSKERKNELDKEIYINSIIDKCKKLGFEVPIGYLKKYVYLLPFGLKNNLSIDFTFTTPLTLDIENGHIDIPLRKIESPEDLENLFNAICPEKYRLPFD